MSIPYLNPLAKEQKGRSGSIIVTLALITMKGKTKYYDWDCWL